MKKITLLLVLFPLMFHAQTVTTIVQNSGVTDDLIFDTNGNLLGADYSGSAVYEVLLANGTSSIFSDGYNTPNGLALHHDGTIYMADNQGNRVYKIFPDGSSEVFVEYFNPSGLIFEQDSDTLIVTSYMGDKISKIAPDSSVTDWTSGGNLAGGGPVGLCYDDDGNLYVGNFDNRKITQILSDGTQVPITQGPTSGWLGFITYSEGYIYGTLFSTHKIFEYELGSGQEAKVILGSTGGNTDGGPDEAKFNGPNGILASPNGDTLYISSYNTSNIRMVTNLRGLPSNNEEIISNTELNIYPNPFSNNVTLSFELKKAAKVSIEVNDIDGKLISNQLKSKFLNAGEHRIEINGINIPNGIHQVTLRTDAGDFTTRKLIKTK